MKRRFNPAILERLRLEAHTIETVMFQRIGERTTQMKAQAAAWQPGPMPDEWLPSDVTLRVPPRGEMRLFQSTNPTHQPRRMP